MIYAAWAALEEPLDSPTAQFVAAHFVAAQFEAAQVVAA